MSAPTASFSQVVRILDCRLPFSLRQIIKNICTWCSRRATAGARMIFKEAQTGPVSAACCPFAAVLSGYAAPGLAIRPCVVPEAATTKRRAGEGIS